MLNIKNENINTFYHYLRYSLKRKQDNAPEILFIVGNGRSGTHMMASVLNEYNDFNDLTNGRENGYVFPFAVDLIKQKCGAENRSELLNRYCKLRSLVKNEVYFDQTHIVHWFHNDLIGLNPKYIMMIRNPFGVIASTMKHKGVESWLKDDPPNDEFVGKNLYDGNWNKLSVEFRAALRWVANIEQFAKIREKYKKNSYIVQYELMGTDYRRIVRDIHTLCGLDFVEKPQKFKFHNESIVKYKDLDCDFNKLKIFISDHIKIARNDADIIRIIGEYGIE